MPLHWISCFGTIFTGSGQDSRDLSVVRGPALTQMKDQFADASGSLTIGQFKSNPCRAVHRFSCAALFIPRYAVSLEILVERLKPCALAQKVHSPNPELGTYTALGLLCSQQMFLEVEYLTFVGELPTGASGSCRLNPAGMHRNHFWKLPEWLCSPPIGPL